MADKKGICGYCGTRQPLADDGKLADHTRMQGGARGTTRVKCNGSGRNPLK